MNNKGKAPENESRFLISSLYQKRLINSKRFICYKSDKNPYNPNTGYRANVTKKSNYRSYDYALYKARTNPDFMGIGFCLGYDDKEKINYCGIDIDKCIDDNGNIQPEAQEIIDYMDSYTEISMSGKGIHILFIGNKQGRACYNKTLDFCKQLEMYDKHKYFALTGNIILNKDIEYRHEQAQKIYKKYFKFLEIKETDIYISEIKPEDRKKYGDEYLQKILSNPKNKIFSDLWHRKIKIKDESSTDLSFFKSLAYWLNKKPELMKEWFYKSPYYKLKDEEHLKKAHRKDYIERTIIIAIKYLEQDKGGKNG